MFCGVVNPRLRKMDGAFAKIADGLLSAVAKYWLFLDFGKKLHIFFLIPHELVQYANLTKVNFLDWQLSYAMNTCGITEKTLL